MLNLLLFLLPLGLDTLGISISLGIKSNKAETVQEKKRAGVLPSWLRSAILFALAESTMPLVGLVIGLAVSLVISDVMRFVGPLILIGVGAWELWEEINERLAGSRARNLGTAQSTTKSEFRQNIKDSQSSSWQRQLLLALSVSLDELAVGFSLGTVTATKSINPLILCILIGLQGLFMALIGIALGRTLRSRLRPLKDWSEILSGLLLIGLGIWLLLT